MNTTVGGPNYQAYALAVVEQVQEQLELLDELRAFLLENQSLDFMRRSAAERAIQLLVEMLIGVSKHYLKKVGLAVPSVAKLAVAKAVERQGCNVELSAQLLGAVGMRNIIVHDYLDLDWRIIEPIIYGGDYAVIGEHVKETASVLKKQVK